MSTTIETPAPTVYYVATPFHRHCAECDGHIDAAIANAKAENLDTLKRWHGGEVPNFPELSTVAHGVTVERQTLAPVAALRDWNDESRRVAATYSSDVAPGFHVNVEDVDNPSYLPYSRKGL